MLFNSALIDGAIHMRFSGGNVTKVSPATFYVKKSPKMVSADSELNFLRDITVSYGSMGVKTLGKSPLSALIRSPSIVHQDLIKIPSDYLWPYSLYVDSNFDHKTTIVDCKTFKWTVGSEVPVVMVWGLCVDYFAEEPRVTGIYFGTAKEKAYYPRESLGAGIADFMEQAENADIILTNSDHANKLKILLNLADEHRVQTRIITGLLTSLEKIYEIYAPGLNWLYPSAAGEYIKKLIKCNRIPTHWETDFYRNVTKYNNEETSQQCDEIIQFLLAASLIPLSDLMSLSIETGIDLGTVMRREEFHMALSFKYGLLPYMPKSTYFSDQITVPQLVDSYSSTMLVRYPNQNPNLPDRQIYCYDIRQYIQSKEETFSTIAPITEHRCFTSELETILSADRTVIAMTDFCVITLSEIHGKTALFIFGHLLISQRGMFGLSPDGKSYGNGFIGLEGSRTPALKVILHTRTQSHTEALVFTSENDTSYETVVCPNQYGINFPLLRRGETSALLNNGIPIPIKTWMNPDGTYSREYNENIHNNYYGGFVQVLTKSRNKEVKKTGGSIF